ncbi:hypothetical protein [Devosia marina]|uniref:Uncharacterized protein n=1 Tax=Devosia marina TaxID=2683198 RepID=A0A7X3FR54_9HYPH|nr:hypothetical protein [Devosia marina]MVS99254.1 hypothetical protein [Devosia marina]
MSRGGARPGAGRPVGSVNRRTAEVIAEAMGAGKTPLEFLLETMRDEELDHKDRAWAAEKAAPFMHPRPAPMERTVSLDLPDTSTVEGIDKALDAIIAAMGKGELSPQEGQGFITAVETRRKAIETGDLLTRIEALEATKR